jgi:riboflavin-specific deaminase-like protein
MDAHRRDISISRPFVRLNVAESVDGKLAPVKSGKVNFGSHDDRSEMESFRAEADGVIIGGGTLVAEDSPLIIRNAAVAAQRLAAKGAKHPKNICVCGSLPPGLAEMRFFTNEETEKLVFTTSRTPSNLIDQARRYAQVELIPQDTSGRVDVLQVVQRLPDYGINRLLLEGGGELNFSMLQAGFVDEVCITLAPFIFGGRSAPTSFGGVGFSCENVRKLSLKSYRVNPQGEVFLRYDVLSEPPTVTPSRLFSNGVQIS